MKDINGIIVLLIALAISYTVGTLFDFYAPGGRIIYEKMVFISVNEKNNRIINTKSPPTITLERENGDKFLTSNAPLEYARLFLKRGDIVDVFWFSPCHELVPKFFSCKEVLLFNDMSISQGIKSYERRNDSSNKFRLYFCSLLSLILLSGLALKIRENYMRKT